MFTQEFTLPKSMVFVSGVASSSWLVFASGVASLSVIGSGRPRSSFFRFVDLREPNRPKWRKSIPSKIVFPPL